MSEQKELTKQMVQDIGEYHACCVLSQMGFRAVRTSQNAKGVDILAYGEKTLHPVTIQVKTVRQSVQAVVYARNISPPEGENRKHLLHGRANQDKGITDQPIARFWVLVELRPDNSGEVKRVHVWDSEDISLLLARRDNGKKVWEIATSTKAQGQEWKQREGKAGWRKIAIFLDAAP